MYFLSIFLTFIMIQDSSVCRFVGGERRQRRPKPTRMTTTRSELPDRESLPKYLTEEDRVRAMMINATSMISATDFMEKMDMVGDDDANDTKHGNRIASRAECVPEPRTIVLNNSETDANVILFPKCVRVKRCGGCCGDFMECVPAKISIKSLRLARITVQSKINEHSQEIVKVEVHDACKCTCKVKAQDCSPEIYRYREDLCKCECLNTIQEMGCQRMGALKFWDTESCMCRCRYRLHCSTGLRFSHDTCRCMQE